jgi:putative inorganic carbon (hco3(-)) transporter
MLKVPSLPRRASEPYAWPRRLAAHIDRWHWPLLFLAAPFLLFPSPARSLALFVLVVLWLAAWRARGTPLPITPFNGALLLLSLMLLVSLGATYSLLQSLPKVAGLLLGMAFFFAAARLATRRAWTTLLLALLAGSAALVGASLVGSRWNDKYPALAALTARLPAWLRGLPGAEEGLDPNQVAGTLLWVAPLALVLALHAWRQRAWLQQQLGRPASRVWQAASAAAVPLIFGALLLTQSRAALAALALTLALGLALLARWHLRPRAWLLLGLGAAAIGLWAATLGRPLITNELVRAGAVLVDETGIVSLGDGRGRTEVWARAIDAVQLFPITGMGMNTFRTAAAAMFPFLTADVPRDVVHAHQQLLQIAIDLGLPGLVAFLAIQLVAVRMLVDIAAPAASPGWPLHWRRALALGLGGGLLAHFLFGMVDAVALGAKTGIVLWIILGLIASLDMQVRGARQGGAAPSGSLR